MIGGLTVTVVPAGTIKIDPETGIAMLVDDACAVVDQRRGIAWVTQRHFDLLEQLAGPAPAAAGGAA